MNTCANLVSSLNDNNDNNIHKLNLYSTFHTNAAQSALHLKNVSKQEAQNE